MEFVKIDFTQSSLDVQHLNCPFLFLRSFIGKIFQQNLYFLYVELKFHFVILILDSLFSILFVIIFQIGLELERIIFYVGII